MPLTDAEYGRFQRPDDVCPFCYGNNVVLEEEEYGRKRLSVLLVLPRLDGAVYLRALCRAEGGGIHR